MRLPGILPLVLILILTACHHRPADGDKPAISVSILPQKYFVERIAGDNFRVNVMVPSGSSPETYEPTPRQMQDVSNSLVYFRIGYIEFENTLVRNIRAQNRELKIVNTAEGVDLIAAKIEDHGDHVHHFGVDPHIWISIPAVRVQIKNMLEAIIEIDPENEDYYVDNYTDFLLEIDQLHTELTGKFSNAGRRSFLVFHPALGYFARDYGLTQISIEQEGKNPTAANIRRIIDLARKEGLRDVFIQMEFERDNAHAIARELGGDVIRIDPLAEEWLENFRDTAEKLLRVLNEPI